MHGRTRCSCECQIIHRCARGSKDFGVWENRDVKIQSAFFSSRWEKNYPPSNIRRLPISEVNLFFFVKECVYTLIKRISVLNVGKYGRQCCK